MSSLPARLAMLVPQLRRMKEERDHYRAEARKAGRHNKRSRPGAPSAARFQDYFQAIGPRPARVSGEDLRNRRDEVIDRLAKDGPKQWYYRAEIAPGSDIWTAGDIQFDPVTFLEQRGLKPEFVRGKRILDIGAFNGTMTFACEDFGATVVAIDIMNPDTTGFTLLHELRGSQTEHVMCAVYDLHPDLFGLFDVVLFSGVHYHLRHPILALERINSVMKPGGTLITVGTVGDFWLPTRQDHLAGIVPSMIEERDPHTSTVTRLNAIPLAGYYAGTYLGDRSNWFIPNTAGLEEMLRSCGFSIESSNTNSMNHRAGGAGRRGAVGVASIRSLKISDPATEFDTHVYGYLRTGDLKSDAAVIGNTIPTRFELARAERN